MRRPRWEGNELFRKKRGRGMRVGRYGRWRLFFSVRIRICGCGPVAGLWLFFLVRVCVAVGLRCSSCATTGGVKRKRREGGGECKLKGRGRSERWKLWTKIHLGNEITNFRGVVFLLSLSSLFVSIFFHEALVNPVPISSGESRTATRRAPVGRRRRRRR